MFVSSLGTQKEVNVEFHDEKIMSKSTRERERGWPFLVHSRHRLLRLLKRPDKEKKKKKRE